MMMQNCPGVGELVLNRMATASALSQQLGAEKTTE
jgi:hypothetical protein